MERDIFTFEWKGISLLSRWCGGDAWRMKGKGFLCAIIMYDFTDEHMILDWFEYVSCPFALSRNNIHVTRKHIDSTDLQVLLMWGHSWGQEGMKEFLRHHQG